jgi:transcriptional regulator with XRE-family HTH domain
VKKIIGNKIRQLRKARGLSQKNLGELLGGIPLTTVSTWETGGAAPNENVLLSMADFFNVSLDYLFGRESTTPLSGLPLWLLELAPDLATLDKGGQEAVKALVKGLKK